MKALALALVLVDVSILLGVNVVQYEKGVHIRNFQLPVIANFSGVEVNSPHIHRVKWQTNHASKHFTVYCVENFISVCFFANSSPRPEPLRGDQSGSPRDAGHHERMPVMLGQPSQATRWQSERVS